MFQLNDESLDLIFREARTHSVWLDKPVDDVLLAQAYDLAKMGPTSANMCPMRVVFVKSKAAKEKLKPALDAGNVDKTMTAPVTAIIAMAQGLGFSVPSQTAKWVIGELLSRGKVQRWVPSFFRPRAMTCQGSSRSRPDWETSATAKVRPVSWCSSSAARWAARLYSLPTW